MSDTWCVTDATRETTSAIASVRTYKQRTGRVTESQRQALATIAPEFDVTHLSWDDILERRVRGRRIVLDIGFGFGESVIFYAHAQPEVFIIGSEVHTPGVGALCRDAAKLQLANVGVVAADVRPWLESVVPDAVFDGVRLFFPDPWPKKRHHKRRFIRDHVLELVANKVALGGFLHIATDWEDYAIDASEALAAARQWHLEPGQDRRFDRPVTKFEQRAINDGRSLFDIVALRV